MCEPVVTPILAAASLAVAAGGAYMQYDGQQQALTAQNRASDRAAAATIEETSRQDALRERGAGVADQTAAEGSRASVDARVEDATERRFAGQEAAAEGNQQNREIAGTGTASNLVRNSIADRTAEARAKLSGEALARARMGAWGDAFTGIGEANQRRRDQIDALGSFSRGSIGASSVDQAAAARARELGAFAGSGDRAVGGGLSALGNAGLSNRSAIGGWFASPTGTSGTSTGAGGLAGAYGSTGSAW